MGALIRALTNNAVENIEEALGMTDATSSAMKHAIAEWYAAWYGRAPTKTEDPCQRLPYAIVNKLCKATFGEYDSGLQHTDSAKGKYLDRVRNTFDLHRMHWARLRLASTSTPSPHRKFPIWHRAQSFRQTTNFLLCWATRRTARTWKHLLKRSSRRWPRCWPSGVGRTSRSALPPAAVWNSLCAC